MKKIQLTQNKYAIVDKENFHYLNQWKWYYHKTGYAVRSQYTYKNGKRITKTIKMHRLILGITDPKVFTDHKNGNRLDNRLVNLRRCNNQQNCVNKKLDIRNTSGYRGVYWHKANKVWCTRIKCIGKQIYMGSYRDKDEAAYIYDQFAIQLFGQFARTNIL